MTSRLIRRFAIVLIAFYAFGQASIALAACGMDRAAMAQEMAMPAGGTCGDCETPAPDSVTALCVAHCTADLQVTGAAPDLVPPAIIESARVAVVPRFRSPSTVVYLPPGAPPRRILLHSFQI